LVAHANPREVEQLMRKNANQLFRFAGQFQIQHDSAFADERSCVDGLAVSPLRVKFAAAGAQSRQEADSNGAPF